MTREVDAAIAVLRGVPPESIDDEDQRGLVAALVSLPAAEDPVFWMRLHARQLVARIALAYALKFAGSVVAGMARAGASGLAPADTDIYSLLAGYPEALLGVGQLSGEGSELPSASALQRTVTELRRIVPSPPVDDQDLSAAPAVAAIILRLLRQPQQADVLQQLSDEAFDECASLAAQYLVSKVYPPIGNEGDLGPIKTTLKLRKRHESPSLSVRFISLALSDRGFMLTTRTMISLGSMNTPKDSSVRWSGFDSAEDERGIGYILRRSRTDARRRGRRWMLDEVFIGQPPLHAPARSLRLQAKAPFVEAIHIPAAPREGAAVKPAPRIDRIALSPIDIVIG